MKLNGCHNHAPYKDSFGSFGIDPEYGFIRWFEVQNPNSKDCQYRHTDLGKADKGCQGCIHKEEMND